VYTESNDRAVYTTLYYDNGEPKKVNNKKEIIVSVAIRQGIIIVYVRKNCP